MTERLSVLPTPPSSLEPGDGALAHPERALKVVDLYKAAIGPRHQAYYLKQFARQEAQPGLRLCWHWPAFVSALNWLIFRQMWGWAGRYAALVCVLAVGVAVGAQQLGLTRMQTLALGAGMWLGVSVLSALLANGLYYRHCMGLIHRVLLDGSTREAAADVLAEQACNDHRWNGQALANVAVLLLLPALAHFAPWNAGDFVEWLQEAPMGEQALAEAQPPMPDPERRVLPAGSVTPTLKITVPDPQPKTEAQPLLAAEPERTTLPQKVETELPAAAVSAAVSHKEKSQGNTVQVPAQTGGVAATAFGVQVGIFAQSANVANAVSKLKAQGLPVYTDPITMSGEARTRVRVGPYARSGEAERVAGQIAGLGLPAVVVPLRSAARPAPSR